MKQKLSKIREALDDAANKIYSEYCSHTGDCEGQDKCFAGEQVKALVLLDSIIAELDSSKQGRVIDTVAGLELFPTQMGADTYATFSFQECKDGYEVIMHFRGERRFALCTHRNDAEVIVEAMSNRNKQ